MNENFEPYQDWTPEGDSESQIVALAKACQFQQEQIELLRTALIALAGQHDKLFDIVQVQHGQHASICEAIVANYEFTKSIALAVQSLVHQSGSK